MTERWWIQCTDQIRRFRHFKISYIVDLICRDIKIISKLSSWGTRWNWDISQAPCEEDAKRELVMISCFIASIGVMIILCFKNCFLLYAKVHVYLKSRREQCHTDHKVSWDQTEMIRTKPSWISLLVNDMGWGLLYNFYLSSAEVYCNLVGAVYAKVRMISDFKNSLIIHKPIDLSTCW